MEFTVQLDSLESLLDSQVSHPCDWGSNPDTPDLSGLGASAPATRTIGPEPPYFNWLRLIIIDIFFDTVRQFFDV